MYRPLYIYRTSDPFKIIDLTDASAGYIMNTVDTGKASINLSDYKTRFGTHFASSDVKHREIKINGYVLGNSYEDTHDKKRKLEYTCAPFEELTLDFGGHYIKGYLSSTIQWSKKHEENNDQLARFDMTVKCLDPMFRIPVYKNVGGLPELKANWVDRVGDSHVSTVGAFTDSSLTVYGIGDDTPTSIQKNPLRLSWKFTEVEPGAHIVIRQFPMDSVDEGLTDKLAEFVVGIPTGVTSDVKFIYDSNTFDVGYETVVDGEVKYTSLVNYIENMTHTSFIDVILDTTIKVFYAPPASAAVDDNITSAGINIDLELLSTSI